VLSGLKRVILWDYPRAGWQYDIIVALCGIFIFVTPRAWFQDQPRITRVSQIMTMPGRGVSTYLVEAELMAPISQPQRNTELARMISTRTGKKQYISRIEPIYDSEGAVHFYVVYTHP
jgi:hypothetical protein